MLAANAIYRYNGRREFLRFDLVQFVYAFVVGPALFVWMKSFLFVLVKPHVPEAMSLGQFVTLDTIVGVIFLYIYAFIVIHSLTKSFQLKKTRAPLYDIFEHSEYYHQEVSHGVIYAGGMAAITVAALINVRWPMEVTVAENLIWLVSLVGVAGGWIGFMGIWLFDTKNPIFSKLIKLLYASFFVCHVMATLMWNVPFNLTNGFFWASFFGFLTTVVLSLVLERPEQPKFWWHRLGFKFTHKKLFYYRKYITKQLQLALRRHQS